MSDPNVAAGLALLNQVEAPEPEVEMSPPKPGRHISEADVLAKVADMGFLRSYVDYCADTTDAPHLFRGRVRGMS